MADTDSRSLAVLAAIVESCGDAIVGNDERGRIITWNPAAEHLFGYSASEAIGQPAGLTVPAEHEAERRRFLAEVAAAGVARRLETRRRRKDQSLVEVEIVAAQLRDRDGTGLGFCSIVRDISERKANEQKSREVEDRFRTFFEHMPGLTYIYIPRTRAPHHGVLHLSHEFADLTGYPPETWRTDDEFIATVVHPDDRGWFGAVNREVERTGGPPRAEYRIVRRDGRVVWVRDQANLVHGEDGQARYWLGFMLDITEQKAAAAAVADALAQLQATNDDLERLSSAKSDFVSMISHELRTPLTSIQGYSELMAAETLSPAEARAFAATINQSALRLARMIGNVLELDRLEAGQTEARLERVDLTQLVEAVLAAARPAAATHRLEAKLDPALPDIDADPDLITTVVTNLVTNAVSFSPAGSLVSVSTAPLATAVALSVADEGIGIPAADREAIFVRYRRIVRPEQLGIAGTGLGLPIARHIVRLHDGEIWVEDNVPRGSIVRVTLPAAGPVSE